jgi:hypothetical protein
MYLAQGFERVLRDGTFDADHLPYKRAVSVAKAQPERLLAAKAGGSSLQKRPALIL